MMQHKAVPWAAVPRRSAPVPILHVRNVPAPLYAELRRLAAARRRSLSAEVLELLDRSIAEAREREARRDLLDGMRRRRLARVGRKTDSTAWIRELRDRE